MPITISYGNPALVGAASFAIGREKAKMKSGAKAADMAQGMLDRRDKKRDDERNRFDRLNKESADRQQRAMIETGRMADNELDRQSRQDAGTAKANAASQAKKDAWANKKNEDAAKKQEEWRERERKRREEHGKQGGAGSETFPNPNQGEYKTPEWDPMPPSGGGMPMPQGGGGMPQGGGGMPQGGGGMPQGGGGMGGGMPGQGLPYPVFRNTQSNRRGFNPRRTQGANSAIQGRYQRYQREWRQGQQAMWQESVGPMPQPGGQPPQPGGQPPQPGGQPPQEYGPIGGGEFEVEYGLTPEQNKRIQDIRTWKGQIDSNPAMDYDQKNEAHMNADQMLEDASVPQVIPKKPNEPRQAWENDVFQTPQGPVAIGPDGMPTFMQGGKETPEEKAQAESQALSLAYASQMNPDGTPRYTPEEIPFAVAAAMDKNPGDRLRVPTPFEESYPNYQTNGHGAYTSPVMPEADAVKEMQGMDPEKYNVQINKSGDGRAQLTVREIPQEPIKTEDKTKEREDKKAEDEKFKSRAMSWDEFRKTEARKSEAETALGEGDHSIDEIEEQMEKTYEKYVKRHADSAKKRKEDAQAQADSDAIGQEMGERPPMGQGRVGNPAPAPAQRPPVLDAAIEASGGPTGTDTISISEAPPLSPAAQSESDRLDRAKPGEPVEDDAPAVEGPFANSDKPREQSADVALGKDAPQGEKDEYNLKTEEFIQSDLEKKYGGDPANMSTEDLGLYIESMKRSETLMKSIKKNKAAADRKARHSKPRK